MLFLELPDHCETASDVFEGLYRRYQIQTVTEVQNENGPTNH